MHVVKDKQGNVISNFYDTMKMTENLVGIVQFTNKPSNLK